MANYNRKYPAISVHETLNETLFVDWEKEYQEEYRCPRCNESQITRFQYCKSSLCQVILKCPSCNHFTSLSCRVEAQFHRYLPNIVCPNPSCTEVGPEGQKGWIYEINHPFSPCRCHFCDISFNPSSNERSSWIGSQQEKELQSFHFDEDIWDLRNFYDNCKHRYLRFEGIQPDWYCQQVKRYLYQLLKTKVYRSTDTINGIRGVLGQFGQIVLKEKLQQPTDISRQNVLSFLDFCNGRQQPQTVCMSLSLLKSFLEWLSLDANTLLKQRDFPKKSNNEPNWLDEPTRVAIGEHLHKIPAPIARHYLVQEYTAARTGDVCRLPFNCLVEENGKWYIKFFQQKVNRWHKIPATREIRRVIEEQQQWIRQTIEGEYPYLFCHFRSIMADSYPTFPYLSIIPHNLSQIRTSFNIRMSGNNGFFFFYGG